MRGGLETLCEDVVREIVDRLRPGLILLEGIRTYEIFRDRVYLNLLQEPEGRVRAASPTTARVSSSPVPWPSSRLADLLEPIYPLWPASMLLGRTPGLVGRRRAQLLLLHRSSAVFPAGRRRQHFEFASNARCVVSKRRWNQPGLARCQMSQILGTRTNVCRARSITKHNSSRLTRLQVKRMPNIGSSRRSASVGSVQTFFNMAYP